MSSTGAGDGGSYSHDRHLILMRYISALYKISKMWPSKLPLPRHTPNGISIIGKAASAQLKAVTSILYVQTHILQTYTQTHRPRYICSNNKPHLALNIMWPNIIILLQSDRFRELFF